MVDPAVCGGISQGSRDLTSGAYGGEGLLVPVAVVPGGGLLRGPPRSSGLGQPLMLFIGDDDSAVGELDPAGEHPVAQVMRLKQPMIWRDLKAPEVVDGRLTCELPPYGYHWFGRREGV